MRPGALRVPNYAENSVSAAVFLYPHRNTRNLFPCPVAHTLHWQDTHDSRDKQRKCGNAERERKATYVNNCCMPCHFTGVSCGVIVRTGRRFYSRRILRGFVSRPSRRAQKDRKYRTYRVPLCTVAAAVKALCQYCGTYTVCDWNPHCHYISAHCYQYVR